MANKFYITDHAVRRYIERFDSLSTYDSAKEAIELGLQSGSHIKQKSIHGHSLWKFGNQDIKAVIKQDYKSLVCVTILPTKEEIDYESEIVLISKSIDIIQPPLSNPSDEKYLRELSLILKEKYNFQIKQKEYEIQLTKNKDLRLKISQLENTISELNTQAAIVDGKNAAYEIKLNSLMKIMITCLYCMEKKKTDPEIAEVLNKINEFDPSIMEYQSSFSSLILS